MEAGLISPELSVVRTEPQANPIAKLCTDTCLTPIQVLERNKITEVLRSTAGNKLETSKLLGMGRQTLYNKIRNYGIQV